MLLITYTIAIALTVVSDEAFTCVAWDSAGTTTSEVTVPIVLAIGLGVGKAINVQVRAWRFAVCGLRFAVCGLCCCSHSAGHFRHLGHGLRLSHHQVRAVGFVFCCLRFAVEGLWLAACSV